MGKRVSRRVCAFECPVLRLPEIREAAPRVLLENVVQERLVLTLRHLCHPAPCTASCNARRRVALPCGALHLVA